MRLSSCVQDDVSWTTSLVTWWRRAGWRAPSARPSRGLPHFAFPDYTTSGELPFSRVWPLERVAVVEALWGEGFHLPGGADQARETAALLGVDSTGTVVDLNAGLGGAGRLIAGAGGPRVLGMATDPLVARLGNDRSKAANLAERAPVSAYDPERFHFDRRHDAIFAHEALFTVLRKDEAFSALRDGLRSHGTLVLTDYVMTHSSGGGRVIGAWRSGEPQIPRPWTIAQTVEQLKRLGFVLQGVSDITPDHRRRVVTTWNRLAGALSQHLVRLPPPDALIDEGELWVRRIAALDTGDLRLYRFHAVAPEVAHDETSPEDGAG